jgi:hypothetical protein
MLEYTHTLCRKCSFGITPTIVPCPSCASLRARVAVLEKALLKVRSINGTWCGAKQGMFHFEPSEEEKKPCGKCALCIIDAALDAAKEGK